MQSFSRIAATRGVSKPRVNPCQLLEFALLKLTDNEEYVGSTGDREWLAVILGGRCDVTVDGQKFNDLGRRPDVFSGKPYAIYMPPGVDFHICPRGRSGVEFGIYTAPSELSISPYVITPEDIPDGKWGASNFTRYHYDILWGEDKPSHRLLVAEVYVPSGNWATYPPHKHEKDNLPEEAFHEEMYFFRVRPQEGFGIARHYTEDGEIDENYTIENNTLFMIPRGYHTVVSAPGYTLYYLAGIAGNHKVQAPMMDHRYAWVQKAVPLIDTGTPQR